MTNNIFDTPLDEEEAEVLASYEAGEWHSVAEVEKRKREAQRSALATYKKDQRINIRISAKLLQGLKERAMQEGLPYQTLIGSILYKYISGKLVEP